MNIQVLGIFYKNEEFFKYWHSGIRDIDPE